MQLNPVEQAKDFCERMTSQPMACEIMERLIAEIERLRVALDVHRRYMNRDTKAQVAEAFETKRLTGKFPFED